MTVFLNQLELNCYRFISSVKTRLEKLFCKLNVELLLCCSCIEVLETSFITRNIICNYLEFSYV